MDLVMQAAGLGGWAGLRIAREEAWWTLAGDTWLILAAAPNGQIGRMTGTAQFSQVGLAAGNLPQPKSSPYVAEI